MSAQRPRLTSIGFDRLVPYVPGEQPGAGTLLKLNTNENPYPPAPRVLAAVRAAADDGLRLYPDPDARALKLAIAAYHDVDPAQVFVGNGSDEVLAHAFRAFFVQDRPILFPDVSYSFYPVYCGLFGIGARMVPLAGDFTLHVDDYRQPNGGIVIANPNAPTGCAIPLAQIVRLLDANPASLVLIDEAYVDFGAESAVPLVARHPNLLVVQTLSKSRSLAGLRVGFAIGDASLVAALETVKGSFNSYPVDRVAQVAAVAAFEDRAHFEATRQRIIADREALRASLLALGFEVLPSMTNFLFARHPSHEGARLHAALRERGILVRHFARPRIADFLRITVGTREACEQLCDALTSIVRA